MGTPPTQPVGLIPKNHAELSNGQNKRYPANSVNDDRQLTVMWMCYPQNKDQKSSQSTKGCQSKQSLITHFTPQFMNEWNELTRFRLSDRFFPVFKKLNDTAENFINVPGTRLAAPGNHIRPNRLLRPIAFAFAPDLLKHVTWQVDSEHYLPGSRT